MRVAFTVSNRHVHLTKETADRLLLKPKPVWELGVRGNYASNTKLRVGTLTFRLLLPFRKYDQFEVLASDCKTLDIKPCYRQSGKLEGAPRIVAEDLVGHGRGVPIPAIVAIPHLHCPEEDYRWGTAEVVIFGPKHVILHDVAVWPTPGCDEPVLHIDRDEAMGFGMDQNAFVEAYVEKARNARYANSAMVVGLR